MSVPHLMNPLMVTATSVLRSLQRISKCDLPSPDGSAAETSGLSSSGDFSSLTIHAGSPPGPISPGLAGTVEDGVSRRAEHFCPPASFFNAPERLSAPWALSAAGESGPSNTRDPWGLAP